MHRLPCLLAMFTATIFASSGVAQDSQPYTIAGDVRAPGNHFFATGQAVDLVDLLNRAGLSAEAGNAVVMRGQPLSVLTSQNIRSDAYLRPIRLMSGDVVVFRRFVGGPIGDGTAVIATGGVPIVVTLPGGAVPLSEVLASLQIQGAGSVAAIHTEWGQHENTRLAAHDLVQHGDVLDLTASSSERTLKTAASLAEVPQTLALSVGGMEMSGKPSMTTPATLTHITDPSTDERAAFQAFPVAETTVPLSPSSNRTSTYPPLAARGQAPSLFVPGDEYEAYGPDVTENDSTSKVVANAGEFVGSGQMALSPVTENSATNTSGEPKFAQARDASASAELDDSVFRSASLQRSVATGPVGSQTSGVQTFGSQPVPDASRGAMNGIFVIGLLMAVVLIVAGWIRTRQEQNMATADGAGERSALGDLPAATRRVAEIRTPQIESDESSLMDDEVCPGEIAEILASTEPTPRNVEMVAENVTEADNMADESTTPPLLRRSTMNDSLEDLIQNRLPLELKQTQLPLQIAMFGRPAGPRRLRIDAAHSEVAPPKMESRARRSSRQQPAGVATGARGKSADSPSSVPERPVADDSSRFDRALNFLEEQSEK